MHLAHPALTTLGKHKGKKKWASAEQKRNAERLDLEWQELQDKWKTDISNRQRERGLKAQVYKPPVNPRVAEIKKFSSVDTGHKGAVTINTKGATIEPQDEAISGKILNLSYNGTRMTMLNTGNPSVPASTISGFFNAPVIEAAVNLNALTVTAAAGAAGTIVFTFAKTGGGNFVLNPASIEKANLIISIDSSGVITNPTWSTPSGTAAATQTLTASGLTAVKHDYVVTNRIKDGFGVGATPKAGSVTVV
jgi:hypothetical protein